MELFEFITLFKPLVTMYGEIEKEKREIYFDNLKHYQKVHLEDAIAKVIRGHETKSFPQISEIVDAVADRTGGHALDPVDGQVCSKCRGGLWIPGASIWDNGREYTMVVPCNACDSGRRRRYKLEKLGIGVKDKPLFVVEPPPEALGSPRTGDLALPAHGDGESEDERRLRILEGALGSGSRQTG